MEWLILVFRVEISDWLDLMRLGLSYCAMFKPFSKLERGGR